MKPFLLFLAFALQSMLLASASLPSVPKSIFQTGMERSTEDQFSEHEMRIINILRREGLLPPSTSRLHLTRAIYNNALHNYQGKANSTARNKSFQNGGQNVDIFGQDRIVIDRTPAAARWQKRNLTWRIIRYPDQGVLGRSTVDDAIGQAMKMWSNISRIDFTRSSSIFGTVDIEFVFYDGNYDADCDAFFETEELAHARFPSHNQAKIHFKGGVEWSVTGSDANLVVVAAHQLGHVLGLNHSSDPNALMHSGGQNSVLGRDDIRAVQALYGARTSQVQPQEEPAVVTRGCPLEVTRYMPDGRPMCAAVYKEANCTGGRLPIEAGNVTRRLAAAWLYEISSAEVNPGCTLKACTLSGLAGRCINMTGDSYGSNYKKVPLGYDDYFASLSCFCGTQTEHPVAPTPPPYPDSDKNENEPSSCPQTVTRYMPDGRRRMCAAVYEDMQCEGGRLLLEHGNVTSKLNYFWINKISSIEVNPDCNLKACYLAAFRGTCRNFTSGVNKRNYGTLLEPLNNGIESLACFCDGRHGDPTPTPATPPSDSDDSAEEVRPLSAFRLGRLPPPKIPNTNIPTCAVLSTSLLFSNATLTWLKKEEMPRTPLLLASRSYRYVVTSPTCNIFQCTNPNFMGDCISTDSAKHQFFTNGVRVGSYVCDCR